MSFYSSIDSQNQGIRVIHLAPGSFTDKICMTLKAVHLNDSPTPQYEALSYVWGTTHCPQPAIVNETPFNITSNLDIALRHLRQSTVERVLWVDAVCINQCDEAEKSLQVQLMRTIYSNATKVTIWMGPADKDSKIIMDCVDEIKSPENTDVKAIIEAAFSFCSREWFTRSWVVQEFELAMNEPDMICGFRSTRLSCVHFLLCCLHNAFEMYWGKTSSAQIDATQQWSAFMKGLAHSIIVWSGNVPRDTAEDYQAEIATRLFYLDGMLSLRQTLGSPTERNFKTNGNGAGKGTDLSRNRSSLFPSVLSKVGHLKATMPADKIYGILGLCHFDSDPILPDYSRPIGQVYSHAMAHIMLSGFEHGYPLWPVGMEWSRAAEFELPSWVPDFSKGPFLNAPAQKQIMGGLHRMCDRHLLIKSMEDTGRCFPFVIFMNDYQTLYAGGVDIGTICKSWPLWQPGCKAKMDTLALILNQVQQRGISRDTLLKAVQGADMSTRAEASAYKAQKMHDDATGQGLSADDGLDLCQSMAWSPARVLFLTNNGHMGVTEGPVIEGDLLVGLFGINFPAVLRGVDEAFKMVNIAHVAHHDLGHKDIPRGATNDDLLGDYSFNIYAIS